MQRHNETGYAFTLNKQPYISEHRHVTGSDLRRLFNLTEDQMLYLDIEGRDEEVHETETIDLARDEVEYFYTLPRNPLFKLRINGKTFEWRQRYVTGEQIRQLGNIPANEKLLMSIQGNDDEISNTKRIDLARIGDEEFYSVPDKPAGTVILTIETPKGKWPKQPFAIGLTVTEVTKLVVDHFQFAADGNYQLKMKAGETLHPERTLESYQLKDCSVLCFTDLGKGA